MEAIYIPRLTKAPEHTEVIQVQEFLPGLETLTPVRGRMKVTHKGNYLEVSAQAETIVTLNCDRCLQQYNHRLSVKTSEMIWLDASADEPYEGPLEREVALEDLQETLPPQGYFEPDMWLYEQLSLEIPLQKVCGEDCAGVPDLEDAASNPLTDRRWASLEALKKQLPG